MGALDTTGAVEDCELFCAAACASMKWAAGWTYRASIRAPSMVSMRHIPAMRGENVDPGLVVNQSDFLGFVLF